MSKANKTTETYVPLSRGIVAHLPKIKGMPSTVYMYLLCKAKAQGDDRGTFKKKISDIAEDLEIDYKTIHSALKKLKDYIEVKPAKNQHELTFFKIKKYKQTQDFVKELMEETEQAAPEATPEAKGEQLPKLLPKQRESNSCEGAIDGGLQLPKKLRSKEGKELKKNLKTIELPDWINQETWQAFLDMRKEIKKPATLEAQIRLIKKLEGFYLKGQNIENILNDSIINSWQSVFPEKQTTKKAKFVPDPAIWGED